ncbi:MAG: efflux RND transporter periplasmic adaptor subunit [Alphaproteobacteria bacterium]|nr:efflux RND transporter periplasmic adaptor subunit [Alphaproteobacteria bacterium]
MRVGKVKNRAVIKQLIILFLCGAVGWFLKGRLTPQMPMMGGAAGEAYVLTQLPESRDISPKKSYIGHVEAIKSVNLKPQITGYVEKVLFQEGSFVNEGDILFIIEQKRYLATVELRQAELNSAKASLVRAERDYKRQKSLSKQSYASLATLDTSESNYLQAKAAVAQAEANLDLAKIDLDYTEIKAPISGFIGKAQVTEGNYVNSTLQDLARIVQVDPIRVAFSVSDKDYLNMRQTYKNGEDLSPIKTELVLPNGTVLVNHLKSRFTDNEINSDTATIAIYAEYSNDKGLLIPGNYVDIRVGKKASQMALLIPQAAIAQDENGNFVMAVNNDNIVEEKRVVLGDTLEDKQIVLDGLNADDRIIIQGLQKVKNGQKVRVGEIKSAEDIAKEENK